MNITFKLMTQYNGADANIFGIFEHVITGGGNLGVSRYLRVKGLSMTWEHPLLAPLTT